MEGKTIGTTFQNTQTILENSHVDLLNSVELQKEKTNWFFCSSKHHYLNFFVSFFFFKPECVFGQVMCRIFQFSPLNFVRFLLPIFCSYLILLFCHLVSWFVKFLFNRKVPLHGWWERDFKTEVLTLKLMARRPGSIHCQD